MSSLEGLKARIETARDLKSIVRTMKALAAVSIRQYERAVEALESYSRSVELGLQVALRDGALPAVARARGRVEPLGAIVVGSDQGLCGSLNDQVVSLALGAFGANAGPAERRVVLAVGARIGARLEEGGAPLADTLALPASARGIAPFVHALLLRIDAWRAERGVGRVAVFHAVPLRGGAFEPRRIDLLPLDAARLHEIARRPWPSRNVPLYRMRFEALFSALVRQHLFVRLQRALAESLAAENGARLAAMQAAEKSIEERIDRLQASFHLQRQSAITAELLDIVSGVEALAPP